MRYGFIVCVFVATLAYLIIPTTSQANFPATTGTANCVHPAVDAGPDGLARIAWSSNESGTYQIYWGVFDQAGNPVNEPQQITTSGSSSNSPRMEVDSQNRSFIAWIEGAGTSSRLWFARVDADGTVAVSPMALNIQDGTYKRFDIAVTPEGLSHIIVEHKYATLFYVYYAVYDDLGERIRKIQVSDRDQIGYEKYPAIGVDNVGTATMVWYDTDLFWNRSMYGAKYTAGGNLVYNTSLLDQQNISWNCLVRPTDGNVWWLMQQNVGGGTHVMMYTGTNAHTRISPLPGPTHRPSVAGGVGQSTYAVWEDRSSGTPRVTGMEWASDGTMLDDAVVVSESSGSASAPNIGTNGLGQYYVAWQDTRDGGSNIYFDSVRSCQIRVTAQIRPKHIYDEFIDPPPAIPGVSVTLRSGGQTYPSQYTDENGLARFAVTPVDPVEFDLQLNGPLFRVWAHPPGMTSYDPVTVPAPLQPGQTSMEYLWPNDPDDITHGPAIQAAYDIHRLRTEFWREQLEHTWVLPSRVHSNWDDVIRFSIYPWLPGLDASGGASTNGYIVTALADKCYDASSVMHELNHCLVSDIVYQNFPGDDRFFIGRYNNDKEGLAIDEALADYFTASFLNDPVIDRYNKFQDGMWQPLRNIASPWVVLFPSVYPNCGFDYDHHKGSTILSSTLWDLRDEIDGDGISSAPITDNLVFDALNIMLGLTPGEGDTYRFEDFYISLLAADIAGGGNHQSQINSVFSDHGMGPGGSDFCPIGWETTSPLKEAVSIGEDLVELTWEPIENLIGNSFVIREKTINWLNGGSGLGDGFSLVASGISDTTYVLSGRDPHTEYVYVVEPVDENGEVGYRSNTIFLPALDPSPVPEDQTPRAVDQLGRWMFNSPNPFNPRSDFHFELSQPDRVVITVHDLSGRMVRDLTAADFPAGHNTVVWDGQDNHGNQMASGVYLVSIVGTGWRDTGKVALLK